MMQKFNVSTASLINHPVAGQMVGYALAYFGFTNGLSNLSEVQIYFTEFFSGKFGFYSELCKGNFEKYGSSIL